MKKNKTALVLMSGGLDSLVALSYAINEGIKVELALTFNYGQRALEDEIKAAKEISNAYNIPHKTLELPFLDKISTSLLNSDGDINFEVLDEKSANAVWVPNRNGLFLNIAASICEAKKYDYIIFGANKEEGQTFPDNTEEFVQSVNKSFKYSTFEGKIQVLAPLINLEKHEIINLGLKLNADFKLLKSCYNSTMGGKSHCGRCESCTRLKNAILKSDNKDLIKLFF